MATAIEIEQISADGRFRMFVLDAAELVVHAADKGERPDGYTESELTRSLVIDRGIPEHDAHLLIDGARARFSAQTRVDNHRFDLTQGFWDVKRH